MEAPLSSPSVKPQVQHSYFTRSASAQSRQSSTSISQQPAAAATATATAQPPRGDDVSLFLQDFSLVAEAAKRAQMAVMMRDFESVGL